MRTHTFCMVLDLWALDPTENHTLQTKMKHYLQQTKNETLSPITKMNHTISNHIEWMDGYEWDDNLQKNSAPNGGCTMSHPILVVITLHQQLHFITNVRRVVAYTVDAVLHSEYYISNISKGWIYIQSTWTHHHYDPDRRGDQKFHNFLKLFNFIFKIN